MIKEGKSEADCLQLKNCMEHHELSEENKLDAIEKGLRRRSLFVAIKGEDGNEIITNLAYNEFIDKKVEKMNINKDAKNKLITINEKSLHCLSNLERLYHPALFKTQPCKDMSHIEIKMHQQNNMQFTKKFTQE